MKKKTTKYVPPEMYESWGGEFKPKKYEVRFKETDNWVLCKAAKPVGKDSLHYMLFDGTQGVAPKGTWREKDKPLCCQLLGDSKPQTTIITRDERHEDDDNILEV